MIARTMKRIVMTAILLIALAGAACAGVVMCSSDTPLEGTRASILNTLLDKTGLSERVEAELYARAEQFATDTGIPIEALNAGIAQLDVTHWHVTELPDDAQESGSLSGEVNGQQFQVTTYDDASLVTLEVYGQQVTFEVPESTQAFTMLAPYASQAQDLGLFEMLGM